MSLYCQVGGLDNTQYHQERGHARCSDTSKYNRRKDTGW